MLRRLGATREMRLNHLRIAKNRTDDVVEVVRNSARQRPDYLHSTGPFQPHRELRLIALEKLTFDRIGHRVTGEPHNRPWIVPVSYWLRVVKAHDASDQ